MRLVYGEQMLGAHVSVAQLDKASDYESEDWGFESLQGYVFNFNGKITICFLTSCPFCSPSACSVMVIIGASQALDPGSIPGRRILKAGALAQSEECALCKREVRGSKPRCSIVLFSFRAFPFYFVRGWPRGVAIALVAQLVEHGSNKPRVGGSSPSWSMSPVL